MNLPRNRIKERLTEMIPILDFHIQYTIVFNNMYECTILAYSLINLN